VELERKRTLLFSTRIRFAPEAQTVREAALQRMVELVLLLKGDGRTVPEIAYDLRSDVGEHLGHVVDGDVSRALSALSVSRDVIGEGHGLATRRWSLSARGRSSIEDLEHHAQSRLDGVVRRIFAGAPGGSGRYFTPLLTALRRIFSHLAEMYVLLIKGDVEPQEFATEGAVAKTVERILEESPHLDRDAFTRGVQTFLLESNPEFDAIKWNLTQNYYLLRVLGLDSSATLLTREVFDGARLFLDTNILVNALTPAAEFHQEFRTLSTTCAELGISLNVCQVTVDELRAVVAYNRWLVTKTQNQVPSETVPKVGDLFFRAFIEARERAEEDPIAAAFDPFDGAAETLDEKYGVKLVDDYWFVEERDSSTTQKLATSLQREYADLHGGREKREQAALHDALVVRWVEREREVESPQTWILTLDTSLTRFQTHAPIAVAGPRALALTLGALLQWVSPIAAKSGHEADLTEIFAQALRSQLLPRDQILQLQDFLVFAEIGIECKELPADDVEECVRHIKRVLPGTDPGNPAQRERLTAEIQRFFLDPARKWKTDLQRLEEDLRNAETNQTLTGRALKRVEEERERLRTQVSKQEAQAAERDATHKREMAETADRLRDLEARLSASERGAERARLRRSAWWRLALGTLVLAGIETALVLAGNELGSGRNAYRRIVNSWPLYAAAAGLWYLVMRAVIDKAHAGAMGFFGRVFHAP
jgi:predicted nucleic acid-binding protein